MAVPPLQKFTSPSDPTIWIPYRQLNPSATHTLLCLYGAGNTSASLALFEPFVLAHPNLSILCIDRWPQQCSRDPSLLLSRQTAITLELLSHLHINSFSMFAHSAGIYPLLSLLAACQDRITHAFLLGTAIPSSWSQSKVMEALATMPAPLFNTVLKVDQMDASSPMVRTVLNWLGKANQPDASLIVTADARQTFADWKPNAEEAQLQKERMALDYAVSHARHAAFGDAQQRHMYMQLGKLQQKTEVTWFVGEKEVFFGREAAERALKDVGGHVELITVEGATHADIWLRQEVWQSMYSKLTGQEL